MNKVDVVKAVSKKTGFSQKDISEVVDNIFNVVADSLVDGEDVNITGFGKFVTQVRSAREGVNPKNLTKVMIPEKKIVKFKPSTKLKEIVNKQ